MALLVYKHGGAEHRAGRVPCSQCLGTRAGATFIWVPFVKLLLVACLSVTDVQVVPGEFRGCGAGVFFYLFRDLLLSLF
jgi:hypothetical protein